MRREPRAHFSGKPKLFPLVVAHQQRIDAVRSRSISADDKLLLLVEFQLDPRAAAFARLVMRIRALGDDALQSDSGNGFDYLLWRARERFRHQDARTFDDGRQSLATFGERLSRQIVAVDVKQIERIEHDGVVAVRGSMLKCLKRWLPSGVERDDLAVENRRLCSELPSRRFNGWIRGGEIVLLAREEPDAISVLQQQRTVSVPLHLVGPVIPFRQLVGQLRHHWWDERQRRLARRAHTSS